ncbi:hypothetical protein KBX37_17745 [Micromonospora sp. U56]|uniref:hypothetical protein n=1 Tax=Micromonospora sp. U56 TaxID=2824900 RepID=UPI001B36B3FB|nr:hypothetical protein [Micromonospora sp. U56]MBQ0894919.1 hypothetical protein [Micromonospora sp. U56]
MRSREKKKSSATVREVVAAATVVGVLATGATAAHAAPEGTDQPATASVTFLSPEQYEQQWGVPSTVPPKVSELADEARVTVATSDRQASGAAPAIEMDPGGGKPAEWWIILKEYRDRSNRTVPVRLGNGALGYNHYAVRHNLRSFAPLEAAFKTTKPDKINGNRIEYIAYVVNTGNGAIHKIVRVITQNARHSSDYAYETPDGKPVGVITAYCQGENKCPDWVNKVPS